MDSPASAPAIEVRNLHFHYGAGDGSLHDVSFTIADKECVAVIGPNGAGKSTLLLHLNGILPEHRGVAALGKGSVHIHGQKVERKNLRDIRRQVGLLFQDPDDQLFCETVFEDVAYGPRQFGRSETDVRQHVERCLAEVGLSGFEQRSPHRLSGGEKRRVCLAGVLACEPSILVLDEPTSGLDPRGRREFKRLLQSLGRTTLIATHDLEMVLELCSRALLLDAGKIIADGPAADLLANEELMLRHGLEKPHSLTR